MSKRQYTSLPFYFEICLHSDCKMADTCLHQLAYEQLMQTETRMYMLNPRKCSKDEHCEFYRDNSPVVYARGFTNFQKRMFPEQYKKFMNILIAKFSRNPYFERRRGTIALPPHEQEIVLNALKEVGVTEEMQFDSYEENTNWYD